jgi:hypothetical protein
MALKIPKNKIQEGKYTSGGELILESSNIVYKGYYYELNNVLYAGKTFDINAPKLVPIKEKNTLLDKGASTAVYSIISGVTSQKLQTPPIVSIPNGPISKNKEITVETTRFYYSKTTPEYTLIREVNEETYKSLQQNPLYKTTSIKFTPSPGYPKGLPQNLDTAEAEMPGIKAFLFG